jgi:hypothetical protein
MTDLYRWIVSCLVWLSADPAAIDAERPRCAAAVAAARASLVPDAAPAPTPTPAPTPAPGKCCGECKGLGYLVMPDGHRVKCPCPDNCPCRTKPGTPAPDCPDGKCPLVPGASPALNAPARPAGGR